MKTVLLLVAVTSLLILGGCSNGNPPPMPDSAPMGWQKKSVDAEGKRGPCSQIWRVEYSGGGIAHVDVCVTSTGLDLQQNWKPKANTVTFFNSKYFVTINWDEGERAAVTELVKSLEKSLKAE
jgi:hypothetical protein